VGRCELAVIDMFIVGAFGFWQLTNQQDAKESGLRIYKRERVSCCSFS